MLNKIKPILLFIAIVTGTSFLSHQAVVSAAPPLISTFAAAPLNQCNEATIAADDNCLILKYLVQAINVLSALVGIVVTIMIVVGGMQYSSARDNPQAAAAAKQKIINALIALVAYLFMWAFLQYIVPGGVL